MKIIVSFFIAINVIAFFTIVDARNLLKTNNSSIVHNNGMHSIEANVSYKNEISTENLLNKEPEYHVPILMPINSMNRTEKSTDKNVRQSFGDDEHYVKVGNFSIPKEFFSPEAQGFFDWIKKGWNAIKKIFTPDNNKNNNNSNNNNNNDDNNSNDNNSNDNPNNGDGDGNGHSSGINNVINIQLTAK
uniref:Rho GTPase-activating protein gacZ-like n=1 Tax=Dermatophagoides pteronyssinus TaxID=6956 RepID=A0A6P6YI06_DERPT|nr:rho GTPase-activating protein gacZ-like [Dermatophagoides pteronyssinus]